jgi:hypothetical protein
MSEPPITDLAIRYVTLCEEYTNRVTLSQSFERWGLKQKLIRRCGEEMAEKHISDARDILKMVGIE